MNLHWFDLTMDMPLREIGWSYAIIALGMAIVVICVTKLYREGFRIRLGPNLCEHQNTRCVHGDEINWMAKQYVFRWWKPEVIRRQVCLDCGEALDRIPICTATGKGQHEWHGPWPDHFIVSDLGLF